MLERCRTIARQLTREFAIYKAVARDPRTPWLARLLLLAAIGYVLLPFDVIPDWIPVLGVLDDLIIVPGLVALALKLIPQTVLDEHRYAQQELDTQRQTEKTGRKEPS